MLHRGSYGVLLRGVGTLFEVELVVVLLAFVSMLLLTLERELLLGRLLVLEVVVLLEL